jgi:hypothetical protein
MKAEDSRPEQEIADHLHRTGYVLLPGWRQEQTTINIGRNIGTVVDISALLPNSGIPTVQTLKPRGVRDAPSNLYSGTFGLAEFPLHTDLAHWARPPRYFLLRCVRGAEAVVTRLLPISALAPSLGTATLRRALARPRRPTRAGMLE